MKEKYIELMEQVFLAYSNEKIDDYTQKTKEFGLSEHGFPRLTSNLGILIAHGKKSELKNKFIEMMNLCCDEIPTALEKNGRSVGNDFSVKEIIFCLLELEKANVVDKKLTDRWRKCLECIVPNETYSVISPVPPVRIGNWAAFGAASEQVRKYAGIGNEDEFIENQIKSQLFSFDSNGMYRDPGEPMVYDFVTRLQLAVIMHFGYRGESYKELEEHFLKAADITLMMQSVSGEIPFGGRSNQFLHNEAFFAALCEFYAAFFKRKCDKQKAVRFKQAAKRAIDNLIIWLRNDVIHHVKNHYDIDSNYGCESYAYFDKYMVTTASWLYLAYIFSDDINDVDDIVETENYICETSQYFHKVFSRFNDYFIEIDTNADIHYDCSGLGKVHKKGAPSAICLSTPFAKTPDYCLDIENPTNYSICGGVVTQDGIIYGFDNNVEYKIVEKYVTEHFAFIKFECEKDNKLMFYQSFVLSDDGVRVIVEGNDALEITFPVFCFDGKESTEISIDEKRVEVKYNNSVCEFLCDGVIKDNEMVLGNRNGHYKAFSVCGNDKVSLTIKIN